MLIYSAYFCAYQKHKNWGGDDKFLINSRYLIRSDDTQTYECRRCKRVIITKTVFIDGVRILTDC